MPSLGGCDRGLYQKLNMKSNITLPTTNSYSDGFALSDDTTVSQRSSLLPESDLFVRKAHHHWLASFGANRNHPSQAHQHAGWQLLRAMVDQLFSECIDRYVYDLPCGEGEMQAVIVILWALFSLKAFNSRKTDLVATQQVNALCDIRKKLLETNIPEESVGIVHSQVDAGFSNTNDKKPSRNVKDELPLRGLVCSASLATSKNTSYMDIRCVRK